MGERPGVATPQPALHGSAIAINPQNTAEVREVLSRTNATAILGISTGGRNSPGQGVANPSIP